MAKVVEDIVILKFSKLVKDTSEDMELVSSDVLHSVEQVCQELVDNNIIVEVIKE